MASGPNHMRAEHKSGNAASSIRLLPPDETRASLSLSLACVRARAATRGDASCKNVKSIRKVCKFCSAICLFPFVECVHSC
jgi:hypothetical protein